MSAHIASHSNLHRQPHTALFQRVLMVFVLLFLALQLLGANAHDHGYTEDHASCAACQVADMPLGAAPAAATVVPVAELVAFALVSFSHPVSLVRTSYLTPPSHAPPAPVLFF